MQESILQNKALMAYYHLGIWKELDDVSLEELNLEKIRNIKPKRSLNNLLDYWNELGLEQYQKPNVSTLKRWSYDLKWKERVKKMENELMQRQERELQAKYQLKQSRINEACSKTLDLYLKRLEKGEINVTMRDLKAVIAIQKDLSSDTPFKCEVCEYNEKHGGEALEQEIEKLFNLAQFTKAKYEHKKCASN
jgi:hypothetical protein